MLKLSLPALDRGEVRLRESVPADDPLWADAVAVAAPVEVDLRANDVGEGVLVRGTLRTRAAAECRRCLRPVEQDVEAPVEVLFARFAADDPDGEVYPLPERGAELDLREAVREQLLLALPALALCREECRGLCPRCGADRNDAACGCVGEAPPSPWDALKKSKLD